MSPPSRASLPPEIRVEATRLGKGECPQINHQAKPPMKKSKQGAGRRIQSKSTGLLPNESPNCFNYVIQLKESVTLDPAFMRKNPGYVPGRPCFYVGMTSEDIEERCLQHFNGTKNVSRIAHEYGLRLRMDLVTHRKPVRRTWALEREARIAKQLRSQGFGAWMG